MLLYEFPLLAIKIKVIRRQAKLARRERAAICMNCYYVKIGGLHMNPLIYECNDLLDLIEDLKSFDL